jgi:acetyltransferase-like isoleucine patch superfamily enzyme
MNRDKSSSPYRDRGSFGNALRNLIRRFRLAKLKLLTRGKFSSGAHVSIARGFDIRPSDRFSCGSYISIGKNFTCESNALIGDHILISSNVSFVSNDHAFDDPNSNIFDQGRLSPEEIILEGDNLIGYGATLIAPCIVERGAIIGAGAVAKGRLLSNTVYGGVPARVIKSRYPL